MHFLSSVTRRFRCIARSFSSTSKQDFQMSGYSSSKFPPKPPIEQHSEHKGNTAPAAARFGRGAKSVAEIAEAAEARRRNSAEWSRKDTGPRTTPSRDNG
jgi:hypothetical protein